MADLQNTIYIPITGKTVAIIFAAVASVVGGNHLADQYGSNSNACYSSTASGNGQCKFADYDDDIDRINFSIAENKLAVSSLRQANIICKEHQKILEEKMDNCRTRVASFEAQINNNKELIWKCLQITGQ